jgi:hypothetical protein
MWYVLTKYSFDAEKIVHGPFKTENEAWKQAEHQADEEYRIDTEECGWHTEMVKIKDANEIIITNHLSYDRTDTTEFIVFEIE